MGQTKIRPLHVWQAGTVRYTAPGRYDDPRGLHRTPRWQRGAARADRQARRNIYIGHRRARRAAWRAR